MLLSCMIHPEIKCSVCKMSEFHKEVRQVILKGKGNSPDTELSMTFCANCGNVVFFAQEDVSVE